MNTTQFYDSKNLAGRILIWQPDKKLYTFLVEYTNPGLSRMEVTGYPLFDYEINGNFYKTDTDIPKLYIVKEVFS